MTKQSLTVAAGLISIIAVGAAAPAAAAEGIGDCASFLAQDPTALGPDIDRLGENVSSQATTGPGVIPPALDELRGLDCP